MDRQFRTILDVQNSIHSQIRLLDTKLAEVVGRQERVISMLSSNQQGGSQNVIYNLMFNYLNLWKNLFTLKVRSTIDTFNRNEANQLINQQNELVQTIRNIQ